MSHNYIFLNSDSYAEAERYDVGIITKIYRENIYEIFFLMVGILVEIHDKDVVHIQLDKTGDDFEYKICDRCFKYLRTEHFQKNRHKKDNIITRRPSCLDCRKEKDGKNIQVKNA